MEKIPFDFFNNNFDVFVCKKFGPLPVADGFIANIRHAIDDIHNSHIALGYALIAFAESHTFGCSYGGGYFDCRTEQFFDKCYMQFHLDKSTVSRHVNVVYRFGDGTDGLRSSFKDRTFSFLAELLPLSEQDIDYCLMHCVTVADVRKYKAELSAKDKPQKSVATSQQKINHNLNDKIIIPRICSSNEFVRYERFRGLTVKEVLEMLISAESELAEIHLSMTNTSLVPVSDEEIGLSEFTMEEVFGTT